MDQSRSSGGYIFTVNMKSMQVILPISMLSFLFSQSPVFDGLLNLLQIYGFDSTSTLSSRAERAYAFLLFNGLLVLLINNNSCAAKIVPESIISSLKSVIKTTVRENVEEEEDHDDIVADRVIYGQVLAADHEECEETEEYDETNHVLADDEQDDEDEDEDDRCDDLILSDDDEETEEAIVWGISVEELNSKCDDFIKNMRHML